MREIKFRAWCRDQKRMLTKVIIGNTTNPDSDDYTAHCIFRDGEWYHSDEHDDVVFEQYTGLKDKNGVEIYEGDVFPDDDGEYFEYVKYCDKNARFILACCCSHDETYALSDLHCDALEVIGNIHQNPELLK